MKYQMYAVYDVKAETFNTPFFMQNDNTAKRGFSDACNNPETPFGQHPEDYTLFHIGEYSDAQGVVTPNEKRSLGNGIEFVRQET